MKRKYQLTILVTMLLCFMASANLSTAGFYATAYITTSSQNCDEQHTYSAFLSGASVDTYSWSIMGDGAFISPTNGPNVTVIPDQGYDVGTTYTVEVEIVDIYGNKYDKAYTRTVPSYLDCGGQP